MVKADRLPTARLSTRLLKAVLWAVSWTTMNKNATKKPCTTINGNAQAGPQVRSARGLVSRAGRSDQSYPGAEDLNRAIVTGRAHRARNVGTRMEPVPGRGSPRSGNRA